jgi:hypothetical protein
VNRRAVARVPPAPEGVIAQVRRDELPLREIAPKLDDRLPTGRPLCDVDRMVERVQRQVVARGVVEDLVEAREVGAVAGVADLIGDDRLLQKVDPRVAAAACCASSCT